MQKENIWKLLARKMTGEATEEESRELEHMLESDAVMKYTAETFSRLWKALSHQHNQESRPVKDGGEEG